MGKVVAVVIWIGMAPGKADALPQLFTVGHMETGCTQVPHTTIVQMFTKKIPPLQMYRVIFRLGALGMERAVE